MKKKEYGKGSLYRIQRMLTKADDIDEWYDFEHYCLPQILERYTKEECLDALFDDFCIYSDVCGSEPDEKKYIKMITRLTNNYRKTKELIKNA